METGQISAVAALVDALAWPVVALIVLCVLAGPVRRLLAREGATLSGPGFAISTGSATAALARANADKSGKQRNEREVGQQIRRAAAIIGRQTEQPHVLWVDDHPRNNRFETEALRALGFVVTPVTSTQEALDELRGSPGYYDLVISDMGRGDDPRAGYTLLSRMRTELDQTPVIFYSSSNDPRHDQEARRRGALGSTNDPALLVEKVVTAVDSAEADAAPPRWRRRHGGR